MSWRFPILKVAIVLIIFLMGALFGAYRFFSRDLPSTARLEMLEPSLKTQIIASDGSIIGEFFDQNRALLTLEEIPAYLTNSVIAIEDRKFYSHWGVDIFSIARALLKDLLAWEVVQGASTITQQLARNLFEMFDVSINRKIKEALLAMKIERTYSKNEILEMYLNQIYFGSGAYGVEAAALRFFGKSAIELTLGEATILAGLPKNPRDYSPFHHLDRALKRRRVVLDAMVDCDMLTQAVADSVKEAPVFIIGKKERRKRYAAYFLEYVRQYLESKYGAERLYHDGLKVYTTLDPFLQHVAEDSMESHLSRLETARGYPQTRASYDTLLVKDSADSLYYLQSAVVALEVQTGHIKALVGGRDFKHSQWNRAVQATRQPGSSFKPFIYIAALENGYTPSDIVLDAPIVLDLPHGDVYKPRNFSEVFKGEITLRYALNESINIAAVRLLMSLGPISAINYAHKLGVKSRLFSVYSLALGSSEVNLLEMTSAYATLGSGGVRAAPLAITKVVNRDGRVLEENFVYREEVLSPQTSYMITNMLESAINEGTGKNARLLGFKEPAAGKTGTTDDCTDAWFIGYTNELAVGVWSGFDKKRPMGRRMTGARVSLPTWTNVMLAYYRDHTADYFHVPQGIVHRVVCEQSGLLISKECTKIRREVFIEGTEPRRMCDIHRFTSPDRFYNRSRQNSEDYSSDHD